MYKGFFGERDKFEERYRGEENPLYSIEELIIPVYIGHGGEDQVVKPVHAERLYHALRDEYVDYPCEFHVDSTAGHDYKYWNSEVSNVLSFFKKYTL